MGKKRSPCALIFGLANLDVRRIGAQFRERTPIRWIAGDMLLVPFLILVSIPLIRRPPWGYVLAGVFTVKGPVYALVTRYL